MSRNTPVDLTVEEDEIEIEDYDTDSDEDIDIIGDDDIRADVAGSHAPSCTLVQGEQPFPHTVELERIQHDCGTISVGDTVELKDDSAARDSHGPRLVSGDFLRIKSITENLDTGQVQLEGLRLRRCSYLRGAFADGGGVKVNDLFVLVRVDEDDTQSIMQYRERISIDQVVRKRDCVLTDKPYPVHSFREVNSWVPIRYSESKDKLLNFIFHQGRLVCRYVYTVIRHANGKSYAGGLRRLLRREADGADMQSLPSSSAPASSSQNDPGQRREYSSKAARLTFGDAFCGVGGVSEGARQADLFPTWALDFDDYAQDAYTKNFVGVEHFHMNAHDFPGMARRCKHGVDILHMSCPCCFWSEVKTRPGQHDQENMEAILTVGPFLKAVKPRYATLEQAPGLLKQAKHKLWFRKLLNMIVMESCYNVRWKILDMAEYGLPQRRRRLIFILAKKGLPLPHFPKPTHGPPGSGLKPWVTIHDALVQLDRLGARFSNDLYHQPHLEKRINRAPFDPKTRLAKCITTDGGLNYHPSGTRRFTPRELAQLQGFRIDYHFAGSRTHATKQAGNAWGPSVVKVFMLYWAQHLEAFDHGLIGAEDDVEDLYDFLTGKGFRIPQPDVGAPASPYRYLPHLKKTTVAQKKHSLWGQMEIQRPQTPPRLRVSASRPGAPRNNSERKRKRVRDEAEIAEESGNLIILD